MLHTTMSTGSSLPPPGSSPGFPSLQALVCFRGRRERYRETIVSTGEVFCGPDHVPPAAGAEGEDLRALRSPAGAYDLAELAGRLPAARRPELILVQADATGRNQPRHLDAFDCPKVLLVEETGRGEGPLRAALRQATEERYDAVVLDQMRQHGHFFLEAGLPRVYWLPGFGLAAPEPAWQDHVESRVVFIGQVDPFHFHRQHLLEALSRAGIGVEHPAVSMEEASALYARSLVSLNCSLNGELNPRVFQVLASGGFLLTDRLSPEAGLERLFRDGEHLVCYDGAEDLQQKIDFYRRHPSQARRIARAGRDEYLLHHRPAQKAHRLVSLLAGESLPDERIELPEGARPPGARRQDLLERAALYDHLQQLQRREVAPAVLFAAGVPPAAVADASDLIRLRILVDRAADLPAVQAALVARGIDPGRVAAPGPGEVEGGLLEFDVVVAPGTAIEGRGVAPFLDHADAVVLLGGGEVPREAGEWLVGRGFQRVPDTALPTYQQEDEVAIGERHFAAGEPEEAARHFRSALAAQPESVRALNDLGVVSHLFGERSASLQFLERALSLDRRDPETLLNLAEVTLQMGNTDEAHRLYEFLAARPLRAPALLERRELLRNELEVPAATPPAPGPQRRDYRMPILPSLRRLRIACVEPLQPDGGSELLLEALIRLAGAGVDWTCAVAGPGPDGHDVSGLRASVRAAGLEERFELLGRLDEEGLADLFARRNVLVVPALSAGAGEVPVEAAMAAGLAVVASAAAAPPLVEDEATGVLFPTGDAGALAAALEHLARDRDRWRRIAAAGELRVRRQRRSE
jgi:glycosyltransferase involved in cell wall biosynthesis